MTDFLFAFWSTLAEMSPWLLFGFLFAGVLSVYFKATRIEKHLGGRGFKPVLKASLVGVPLPLCSCGVIPVATSLYRHGASRGATATFLITTPQTGVDSVFATYALMGPVYAIARPIVEFTSGIVCGTLVNLFDREPKSTTPGAIKTESTRAVSLTQAMAAASPCCGGSKPEAPTSCCSSDTAQAQVAPHRFDKAVSALRYAFFTLPADIAGSLFVGLLLAAALTAWLPPDALAPYLGGGVLSMLAAIAVGLPLYVCATGSIPVGLGLLAAGASPGAALAFLISGPASNTATIAVTWKVLGARTGMIYVLTIVTVAISAGLAFDALFTLGDLRLPEAALAHDHHHLSAWDHAWAIALLLLLLPALTTRVRAFFTKAPSQVVCCTNDHAPHTNLASHG